MLELSGGAALVVGHPGHELRVHGWLERAKPHVLVLSDGSGRCGKPRLDSTTAVLNAAGAIAGNVFGRYPDRELYDCLLQKRFDFFLSLAAEVAAFVVEREILYVVGDRAEGYNTVHDVCRLVINAALDYVLQTTGREIPSYDFAVAQLSGESETGDCETICFELNDAELGRKIAAALN